jgi:hypothetical protein
MSVKKSGLLLRPAFYLAAIELNTTIRLMAFG